MKYSQSFSRILSITLEMVVVFFILSFFSQTYVNAQSNNCNTKRLSWFYGPDQATDSVTVCGVNIDNYSGLNQEFILSDPESNVSSSCKVITKKGCGSIQSFYEDGAQDCAYITLTAKARNDSGGASSSATFGIDKTGDGDTNDEEDESATVGDEGYVYEGCAPQPPVCTDALSVSDTSISPDERGYTLSWQADNAPAEGVTLQYQNQNATWIDYRTTTDSSLQIAREEFDTIGTSLHQWRIVVNDNPVEGCGEVSVTIEQPSAPVCTAELSIYQSNGQQQITINPNEIIGLEWNATFDSATINDNPVSVSPYAVSPLQDTTYILMIIGGNGETIECGQVDVEVREFPTCSEFTASPNPVDPNATFSLSWDSTNQTNARITANGITIADNISGNTHEVTDGITEDTDYQLIVFNDQLSTSCDLSVTVQDPQNPTPVCTSVSLSETEITLGESTTLTWETSNTTGASLTANPYEGSGLSTAVAVSASGSRQIEPSSVGFFQYDITPLSGNTVGESCSALVFVSEGNSSDAPTCTLSAQRPDGTQIAYSDQDNNESSEAKVPEGGRVQVLWNSTNAQSATISINRQNPQNVTPNQFGSVQQIITADRDYLMTVLGNNGQTVTCNLSLEMESAPDLCQNFRADPVYVNRGQSFDLLWDVPTSSDNLATAQISQKLLDDPAYQLLVNLLDPDIVSFGTYRVNGGIQDDTWYQLYVRDVFGREEICLADAFITNGGGGGSDQFACRLTATPNSLSAPQDVTINWEILVGTPVSGNFFSSDPAVQFPAGPFDFSQDGSVSNVGLITQDTNIVLQLQNANQTQTSCSVSIDFEQTNADQTDISVVRFVSSDQITVGQTVIYTLNYANLSGEIAENVTLNEIAAPSGRFANITILDQPLHGSCSAQNSGVQCGLGTLFPGANGTIRYQADAVAAGVVAHTATIATTSPETTTANNIARQNVTVINASEELSCTLTASPNPVTTGGNVFLSWTVTGSPTGGTISSTPFIGIPGPNDFTRYGSTNRFGPITQPTNFVLEVMDENGNSANCAQSVTVQDSDLRITKSASPTLTNIGGEITYTLTYQNAGQVPALNVTLEDQVQSSSTGAVQNFVVDAVANMTKCFPNAQDDGISCHLGNVPAGASGTITYTATASAEGRVDNRAALLEQGIEVDSDTAQVQITDGQLADVTVTKTADRTQVGVGDTVIYTLQFANNGDARAVNVSLVDRVDTANSTGSIANLQVLEGLQTRRCSFVNQQLTCSLGSLNPGQTGTLQYQVEALSQGNVINLVEINTTTPESDETNNTAQEEIQIGEAQMEFEITKNATPDLLGNEQIAEYSITITSAATQSIANIQITDVIQEATNGGTLSVVRIDNVLTSGNVGCPPVITAQDLTDGFKCEDFAPNDSITITYALQANTSDIPADSTSDIDNIVTLSNPDTQEVLGTATETVTLRNDEPSVADLALTMNVDDACVPPTVVGPPRVATTLSYDLIWENLGTTAMNQTEVEVDCPDAGITLLSASGNSSIDQSANVITWNLADLEPQSDGVLLFEVELDDGFGLSQTETFTCTARIESMQTPITLEVNQQNNTDDDTAVEVRESCRDARAKRVHNLTTGQISTAVQAQANDLLEYTLSYTAGDQTVTGFVFEDEIGDVLMYSDLIRNPDGTLVGGATLDGTTLRWNNGGNGFDIAPFTTREVRFQVQIFDDQTLAQIGGDFELTNAYGNTVTVVTLPELIRTKSVAVNGGDEQIQAIAEPGDILRYTLTVQNVGNAVQDAFVIEDDVSDILELSQIIDNGGATLQTNAQGQQILSWEPTDIPAGATVSRSFTAQVDDPLVGGGDFTLRNVYGNVVTVVTLVDISLSKSVRNEDTGAEGVSVSADQNHVLTYALVAENTGDDVANAFVFRDDVSDILQYATVGTISDEGRLEGNEIVWDAQNIAPNQTSTVTFQVTILPRDQWPEGPGFDLVLENIFGNRVLVNLPGTSSVNTQIIKTASTPSAAPEQELTYTLTYSNQGTETATNVIIEDDLDESSVELITDSLPANCAYVDLQDPLQINGGPFGIRCTVGTLAPDTLAQNISYRVTVRTGVNGTIANTARIDQDQVDADPSDNEDSAQVTISDMGLIITKTASRTNLRSAQTTTYTIRVENRGQIPESFTVDDEFLVRGNVGVGEDLDLEPARAEFVSLVPDTPVIFGEFAGTNETFIISDLAPQMAVVITYDAQATIGGLRGGQSSQFLNRATIRETGAFDQAEVFIFVPRSGGEGGGGGGGGGARIVDANITFGITKYAQGEDGQWYDANSVEDAVEIESQDVREVQYRVVVEHQGNITGREIDIQDIFESASLSRLRVTNVEGAEWDADTQTFTIGQMYPRQQQEILYTAVLQPRIASGGGTNVVGVNTATVVDVEAPEDLPVRFRVNRSQTVGDSDPAYIQTEGRSLRLLKRVSKNVVKPGEEMTYTLLVRNVTDGDYLDVVLRDEFPYEHLEILDMSHAGIRGADSLEFRKHILRPGKTWSITIPVRIKDSVAPGTRIENVITISASNADLSDKISRVETLVTFTPPPRIVSTGSQAIAVMMILFFASVFGVKVYERRRNGMGKI